MSDKDQRLGNDPFQRGAARRETPENKDAPEEKATPKAKAAPEKAKARSKAKPRPKAKATPKAKPAAKAKAAPVHRLPDPPAEPAPDDLPPWVHGAATVYAGPDDLPDEVGAPRPASPAPTDEIPTLDEAVRAAGLGGTALVELPEAEEPPRAVSGLERLLRSLLGPNLAGEVQEAIAEVAELARRAVLGSPAGRRARIEPRRDAPYDDFGLDRAFEARVRPLFQALFERYFRVEVRGIENVPGAGRCMLVCNHSGALPYDGTMVKTAVELRHPEPRPVRPLVEDFVYHFPFLGTFINRYGGVRACPENAERLLDHDALVAVFPEGLKGLGKLYRQRYQLQRFGRGGFVKIALRTGTPIVPVAVVGAEEIHPLLAKVTFLVRPLGVPYVPITPTFPLLGPLGLLPLPSKWTLVFGEPVDLSRYGPEAASDRILVNRLAESIRSRIQTMVDDVLETRRGVFRG